MADCSESDCFRPVVARGWCDKHYAQLRPRASCSEPSCDRPVKGRGICAAHAEKERRRRIAPPKTIHGDRAECAADGCHRKTYTPGTVHCRMHYMRQWRHGSLEPKIVRGPRGMCAVDDCPDEVDTPGVPYCRLHQIRFRRHGDPSVVIRSGWKGDDVGYQGAHRRVHALRGKAEEHICVDCGTQARHWSYDHADPAERLCSQLGSPYSLDPGHYQPRCLSCHTRFDKGLERVAGVAGEEAV